MMNVRTFLFILVCLFTAVYSNAQKEIKIGNQIWMDKNLNVDTFRNGDKIPEAASIDDWVKAGIQGKPVWCHNSNAENSEQLGKLYNWYAIIDPRGLSPQGWHVPSVREWKILNKNLGGRRKSATKLKSKDGWETNRNGTNEHSFNGNPSKVRAGNGEYGCECAKGKDILSSFWWSSTEQNKHKALGRGIMLGYFNQFVFTKNMGVSIRCVKN